MNKKVTMYRTTKLALSLFPCRFATKVNLDTVLRSNPRSLELHQDSHLRVVDPTFSGFQGIFYDVMFGYNSQHNKYVRQASTIYSRVISQADNPAVYHAFNLENTFRTNFSMIVAHMWLVSHHLKAKGSEGADLSNYVLAIHKPDLKNRMEKAGVSLKLSADNKTKLEEIRAAQFDIYDSSMVFDAGATVLKNAVWKNVFYEGGSSKLPVTSMRDVLAFIHYFHTQHASLSLTDVEAMFSGNFVFTSPNDPQP